MELSSQQGEIPIPIPLPIQISIPINSSYGGGHAQGHMIHHEPAPPNHIIIPTSAPHNHIIPTSAPQISSNGPIPTNQEDPMPYKKMVRYKECLKNHAAAMGGNATDGCGEYMPSGLEGTLEALICSACNCHRNFHRKEVEGENNCDFFAPQINHMVNGRKLILGHHHKGILGTESLGYPRTGHHHQIMMSYNVGSTNSESDEQDGNGGGGGGGGGVVLGRALQPPLPPAQMVKKRFRTKFSQEQKGKMLEFAEKVGWKIQKQEENVVQQFCQEIGVKRRVLKVWMHNNKHNLAKKNSSSSSPNPI